jgi:hypothetical protein
VSTVVPKTKNRNRRPSGRKYGKRWPVCCGPVVVTGTAAPPVAETRISGLTEFGTKTITPSAPHVPP